MSTLGALASFPKDYFQCPICSSVFTDPVTTPCGHSFCRSCLSRHWDDDHSDEPCRCPTCNKRFHARPEISTNAVIDEISSQIKRRRVEAPESPDAPWRVKCEVCADVKRQALKSCLVCLTSYCETHLEPHLRVPSLMRHRLTEPVENLEERMCPRHQRLLEVFCRDERAFVCLLCGEAEHKDHDTVPVDEEGALQRGNIEVKKAEIQTMIEARMEKMKEFLDLSETRREKADQAAGDCDKLFTTLVTRVHELQTEIKSDIQETLRQSREKDEALVQELEEEIGQLQRKSSELDELSQSNDHFQLLQLSSLSGSRDWSQIRVYSDMYLQTLRRAMTHLVHMFQTQLKTLTDTELTRMRQYKESVTFDPTTAGSNLVISELGKHLKHSKNAADSSANDPRRFHCPMVLGTKGFSSGRHYWEVQVGVRNDWDVGVAKETVARKGSAFVKRENGFYAIGKTGFDYEAQQTPYKVLHLCPRPRNIGVYTDYEEGRVSFYDVNEKLHIYSFTGESFTEKLFPYFYLYSRVKKSEPLVITNMEYRGSLVSLLQSLQKAKDN